MIDGDIVKRFITKGKFVCIVRLEKMYTFKIDDKCNKKEYYTSQLYETQNECEKAAMSLCKKVI